MQHPLQRLPGRARLPVFLALAASSGVVHHRMGRMSKQNKTPEAPRGMLSLLLGGSAERDGEVLASWDGSAQQRAVQNLRLDPLFSMCWTSAAAIGCMWAAEPLGRHRPVLSGLATWLVWAELLAAVLATQKDLLLLAEVHRPGPPWPKFAKATGLLEVALKSAGIGYGLAGGLTWYFRRTATAIEGK